MTMPRTRAAVLFPLLATLFAGNAGADIIYDSIRPAGGTRAGHIITDTGESDSRVETVDGLEHDSRVGDAITFGGTARLVTDFRIELVTFNQPPGQTLTLDVELTIYESISGLPGAAIWSGTRTGFAMPPTPTTFPLDFAPNIELPDSICFAVSFANIAGSAAFPALRSDSIEPFIGSSPAHVIYQATATGEWTPRDEGELFRNISARVTAVPAPGAAAAGALAVLGTLVTRPRRR